MLQSLNKKQFLNSDLDTVWNFMSRPENLSKITPEYMGFEVLTDIKGIEMYSGQIIEYKVSPMMGIKLHWVTEITHVKNKSFFVDEQRFGPYKFWHHQHHLKEVEGGVEMIDIIHYKIPFGFLGKIANTLLVKKQLEEIFSHRFRVLDNMFNKTK
ncbi:MAG: SRPBCC family protein [Bacteroidota bacterium]|jgi:ligand-binding SRPBCC domain-containing protein